MCTFSLVYLERLAKVLVMVCCCSVAQLCLTLCDPMDCTCQASLFFTISRGVCSNSCPLSRCCHPAISSFVVLSSSCPQSFPASRSFPTSRLFALGGQSIGASASASVLPMYIQGWFPLGLTGLIMVENYLTTMSVLVSKSQITRVPCLYLPESFPRQTSPLKCICFSLYLISFLCLLIECFC